MQSSAEAASGAVEFDKCTIKNWRWRERSDTYCRKVLEREFGKSLAEVESVKYLKLVGWFRFKCMKTGFVTLVRKILQVENPFGRDRHFSKICPAG